MISINLDFVASSKVDDRKKKYSLDNNASVSVSLWSCGCCISCINSSSKRVVRPCWWLGLCRDWWVYPHNYTFSSLPIAFAFTNIGLMSTTSLSTFIITGANREVPDKEVMTPNIDKLVSWESRVVPVNWYIRKQPYIIELLVTNHIYIYYICF